MSPTLTLAVAAVLAAIGLTAIAWWVRQRVSLWIASVFCWVMVFPQLGVIFDSLVSYLRTAIFGS
jgi:hypothetical protein